MHLSPVDAVCTVRDRPEGRHVDSVGAEHGCALVSRRAGGLRSAGVDEAKLGLVIVVGNAGVHAGVGVVVGGEHLEGSGNGCGKRICMV